MIHIALHGNMMGGGLIPVLDLPRLVQEAAQWGESLGVRSLEIMVDYWVGRKI